MDSVSQASERARTNNTELRIIIKKTPSTKQGVFYYSLFVPSLRGFVIRMFAIVVLFSFSALPLFQGRYHRNP